MFINKTIRNFILVEDFLVNQNYKWKSNDRFLDAKGSLL